jgi:hypothetical protein
MGSLDHLGLRHVSVACDCRGRRRPHRCVNRGPGRAMWTRTLSPSGVPSAWTGLGGQVITSPAAVASAPGSAELYAVGTDHAVWRDALSGGTWSGWKSLGGVTYSAPAAAWIPGSNGVWVFARGTDNALYATTGKPWLCQPVPGRRRDVLQPRQAR